MFFFHVKRDAFFAQLADTTHQLQSFDNYIGGIVTIIDDNSPNTFFSRWKAVADANNIKISVAVNTQYVGNADKMTLSQLKQLKSEGYDILSHGFNHPDLSTYPMANYENQLSFSLDYLKSNNLGDNLAFVYPYGLDDKLMKIRL